MLTSFGFITAKRGGMSFDHDEKCIRGLETLTDSKLNRREFCEKKELRKAIKAEEKRQKAEKTFPDMEKFRAVSRRHTKASTERAVSIAHEDAKAVGSKSKAPAIDALYRRSPLSRLRRHSMSSFET